MLGRKTPATFRMLLKTYMNDVLVCVGMCVFAWVIA